MRMTHSKCKGHIPVFLDLKQTDVNKHSIYSVKEMDGESYDEYGSDMNEIEWTEGRKKKMWGMLL